MRGLNKVTLIGILCKDPETQVVKGSIHLAKFNLSTTKIT
jgi:single-stranded DNA-binding protein